MQTSDYHLLNPDCLPGSAIVAPERSLRLPAAACSLVRRGAGRAG